MLFWRLKYRPVTLETLKPFYKTVYDQFRGYIEAKNFPHLLLIGPHGSGKTMVAEVLAREILGTEFNANFQLLFADDPIGKKEREESNRDAYVSTKRIGSGAGSKRTFRPFVHFRVRPFVITQKFGNAPFKILCVKNFHALDVEQQAFRRIMEQYSQNCRMILITDRVSGIIDPILSRCQIIMLPYLNEPLFNKCLKTILDNEKIPVSLDILSYARYIANNNIGKALDLLQLTYLQEKTIGVAEISKIGKQMMNKSIESLFWKTIDGNFKLIRKGLRDIFTNENLSKNEILLELDRYIFRIPLDRITRAKLVELIAQTDFDSLDSTDDEIQIESLLVRIASIGKEIKIVEKG